MQGPQVAVSRGLFNYHIPQQELGNSPEVINAESKLIFQQGNRLSHSTVASQSGNLHDQRRQAIESFFDTEFQTQVQNFKVEMNQVIREYFLDYRERALKNHETISAIKESIQNNRQNLIDLDKKIEEYYSNLDAVSSLIRSEIEVIKKNLPSPSKSSLDGKHTPETSVNQSNTSLHFQYELLKEELEQTMNETIERYTNSSENESEEKVQKLLSEITANMENKINKVLNHLNGKVAVLEKQVQNYNRYDDPILERIKFEIEDRFNENEQFCKEELAKTKRLIQGKADEKFLRDYINGFHISTMNIII